MWCLLLAALGLVRGGLREAEAESVPPPGSPSWSITIGSPHIETQSGRPIRDSLRVNGTDDGPSPARDAPAPATLALIGMLLSFSLCTGE